MQREKAKNEQFSYENAHLITNFISSAQTPPLQASQSPCFV